MDWKAPTIEVTLAGKTLADTVERLVVEAGRSRPVATADLTMSNIRSEWEDGAGDGDALVLQWGYRGEDLHPLFDGTVRRADLSERLHLFGLCRARQLAETKRTVTYQREAASVIVKHLVDGLDFTGLDIEEDETRIELLPLCDHSVLQALRAMSMAHDVTCDASGCLHWRLPDESQDAARDFVEGEDVLSLRRIGTKHWVLDAFAVPLWHSQIVSVEQLDGTVFKAFIEQVRHTLGINDQGARSRLWLREVV